MDNAESEKTDGSSIKPVSSLLSHFEHIASVGPPSSQGTSREGSPRRFSRLEDSATVSGVNSARSSLDVNVREVGYYAPVRLGEEYAQPRLRPPPQNVGRSNSPHGRAGSRPTSAVFMQPSNSPSGLIVGPPRLTPQPLKMVSKVAAASAASPVSPLSSSNPSSPQQSLSGLSSSPNPTRHLRMPSLPKTPVADPRRSPFLSPAEVQDISSPPFDLSDSRHQLEFKPSIAPPPVNRAEKPKNFERTRNVPSGTDRATSQSLAPRVTASESRASPFSTPPSSDDSPSDDPLPKPRISEDRGIPKIQSGVRQQQDYFDPPPIHPPLVQRHYEGKRSSYVHRASESPQASRPEDTTIGRTARKQADVDTIEARPELPPRRDINLTDVGGPTSANPSRHISPARRGMNDKTIDAKTKERPRAQELHSTRNASYPTNATSGNMTLLTPGPSGRDTVNGHAKPRPQSSIRPETQQQEQAPNILPDENKLNASLDYPDSSQANRRRPYFKKSPQDFQAKFDTRVFSICGPYICTTGHLTRAWNTSNGELAMSLSHGETVKITSLEFKPAVSADYESTRVWLGSNHGEISEIDIPSQDVIHVKNNAHSRREIIKIHRYANEMWSLDDDGKLHVWPPDETGVPNLRYSSRTFRVPKGYTFSMVVGGQLWMACGKEIRIFRPSVNSEEQFQVLSKPLIQPGAGEVTSGATVGSKSDRIYFGHTDGKVTIYSRRSYSCLGVVNISLYKINSLVGVGDYLWAGFKTGMLYVYDISTTPWQVKKDWHAHENPVVSIMVDQSSIWTSGRVHVASLGSENCIRIWDGMLKDDWLETDMHAHDVEYCTFREVRALVMTWNAGASTPQHLRHDEQDSNFFRKLLLEHKSPDIIVFGFQELVDLEDKKVTARSFFKSSKKKDSSDQEHMSRQYRAWRDYLTRCIVDTMPSEEPYYLLHTASLVGLFTCIFVKQSERENVRGDDAAEVKRGMGGLHGNKGALIARFILDDSSLCFVNCHLAAGQTQTVNRNNDVAAILETPVLEATKEGNSDRFVGGGDGSMILDHEICILNGDLNYRIDTMGRDTVVSAVEENNLAKLLARDQLLLSRKRNPGFRLRVFSESPITFAPTYKYDVGSDRYDSSEKKRAPAWCDRVLYRGLGRIKPIDYRRYEVRVSDHRPVSAAFKLWIKSISPRRRATAWEQCEQRFEVTERRLADEAKMDFLVNVCGFDVSRVRRTLEDRQARSDNDGKTCLSDLVRKLEA
ncbi:MAG: hypothetical protein M1825_005776 [Sarcosagium campestre]|nr:MAG: hypothetical protein M1825_005776 [Sarcosagium campestre]